MQIIRVALVTTDARVIAATESMLPDDEARTKFDELATALVGEPIPRTKGEIIDPAKKLDEITKKK